MKAAATSQKVGPPERRFGRTLIGVGAAVALAVVAVELTRGGGPAAIADAASASAATAPPAAATVDVSISADPPEARVYLDDVALTGNPFQGAMAKSPLARHLRVTAPGFAPEERLVTLDRDIRLELQLKKLSTPGAHPGSDAPQPAAANAGSPTPPPTPVHPGAAAAPAAAARPPTAGTSTPGEALTNPTRKKTREIDTTF